MKELCVDREECVGCCRCVDFAPTIFEMVGGLAKVAVQPTQDELADANNARENCPVEAIAWQE